MALYEIFIMLILMYFGGLMFFTEGVDLVSGDLRDKETLAAKDLLKLHTFIFHTYVLMNIFNAINCRVVDAEEKNVFKTLMNNPLFWFITAIELGV
jgi:hypothetical protein